MTKDEIIELAKQSDLMADGEMWFSPTYGNADVHIADLERFAKLVAEKAIKESLAQPTSRDYAMGYAEGFEDGCKPKPEQEPIGEAHLMQKGFTHCIWSETCVHVGTKLYTTPPQRPWVGLTKDEMLAVVHYSQLDNARAIEAKLRELNNA